MNNHYRYPGKELALFQEAGKWKRYMAAKLKPYVSGQVLEVGAGTGETTRYLLNEKVTHWTYLEPDEKLFGQLRKRRDSQKFPVLTEAIWGNLSKLPNSSLFDTILYIDVLEHIEDDKAELSRSLCYLKKNGRLIVLSPAHQMLYSPFDEAIGHYRRYSKHTLRTVANLPDLIEEKIFYLESTGIFLLWLNKWLVKKKYPTKREIWLWQTVFIPISKVIDKISFYSLGKSIIGIWRKR
jgi:ubiquinone/menaquinone biosynthesis C-methylase UbiE